MTKLMSVTAVIVHTDFTSKYCCYHRLNQTTLNSPPAKSLHFTFKRVTFQITPNNKQYDHDGQVQITIMFRSTVGCAFRGSRYDDDDGMLYVCIFEPRCFPLYFFSCFVLFCSKYRNQQQY